MAQNIKICQIDAGLKEKLRKFNFRKEKTTAAITMKIDRASMTIVTDEEFEDISIEDLSEELPAQNPCYFVYSYVRKHDDGRVSYPLVFVFVSPQGCKPELQMMYAGSKLMLVQEAGLTKVFEVRSTEELTEEWLLEKLSLCS